MPERGGVFILHERQIAPKTTLTDKHNNARSVAKQSHHRDVTQMARRRLQFTLRLLLLAVLLVAIALGSVVATRESTVNRSNYDKIRIGMHESDVNELFQQSPVDLAPLNFEDIAYNESMDNLLRKYPPPHAIKSWKGDRYLISICLDSKGRVASKYYKRAPDASLLDRIADWLGI